MQARPTDVGATASVSAPSPSIWMNRSWPGSGRSGCVLESCTPLGAPAAITVAGRQRGRSTESTGQNRDIQDELIRIQGLVYAVTGTSENLLEFLYYFTVVCRHATPYPAAHAVSRSEMNYTIQHLIGDAEDVRDSDRQIRRS